MHFPACFLELPPETEGRGAAYYLGVERWVAEHLPEDDYLFTWQLQPTVVCGRNQVVEQEVNVDFCREHGIEIVQRHSGGGAIYADRNNIMVSLVTRDGPVEPLFREYAAAVAALLTRLGAPCEATGRNDIELTGGGKVCGNAFYHMPVRDPRTGRMTHRNIVHGTMLYDTDAELMSHILTPPEEKLRRHGVSSVKARVATLKDFLPFGVDELRRQLREGLTNRSTKIPLNLITL